MARFLHHQPCTECGSKDNLGVYDDGSVFCFGCHYYEPPRRTLSNSQKEQQERAFLRDSTGLSRTYSTSIPNKPLAWLKSYGISEKEIEINEILWCHDTDSLVLGPQHRYFGDDPDHPKCITYGPSENWIVGIPDCDVGVFVEDFISAIKVGRCSQAFPIFGSHINASRLKWASERVSRLGVWLDPDKTSEGSRVVLRAQAMGYKGCFQIRSGQDPKYYSEAEIRNIISTQGNFPW